MQPINANLSSTASTEKVTPSAALMQTKLFKEIARCNTINIQTEAQHKKNKEYKFIQTNRKCQNMTEFISKYENELKKLSPNNSAINIDKKIEIPNDKGGSLIKYKYDKRFKNEKHLNKQIIKLIVDIICPNNTPLNDIGLKIKLKISYLYKRGFMFPFFIVPKDSKDTHYCITYIFNFIKRAIKGKDATALYDKIFENISTYSPQQPAPQNANYDCIVCDDTTAFVFVNKNCNCNDNICPDCYDKLPTPKKCPTCRKQPFNLKIDVATPIPAKRHFKMLYNNRIFEREYDADNTNPNYNLNYHENDIVYLQQCQSIERIELDIKENNELIHEYIANSLSERIGYYSTSFLYDHFDLPFSEAILEAIFEKKYELPDGDILHMLGLTDDPEDETTLDFIKHCIELDGLKDALLIEIMDEIKAKDDKCYQVICDLHFNDDIFSM
jgi:hypothetical protein